MFTKNARLSLVVLIGALLPSGCAHLYDPIDESLSCLHCEVAAAQTWHYLRHEYAQVNYPHHFGAGFRAGYVNVCRGRGECPPTLPPKSYWTVWYRNPSGRQKAVEWFNGFSAGAAVAIQDGHAVSGELVTAPGTCDQCAAGWEFDDPLRHSLTPRASEPAWQVPTNDSALPLPPQSVEEFRPTPAVPGQPSIEAPPDPAGFGPATAPKPLPRSTVEPETDRTPQPPILSPPVSPPFGHSVGTTSPAKSLPDPEIPSRRDQADVGDQDQPSSSISGDIDAGSTASPEPSSDTSTVPEFTDPTQSELPYLEDRFLPRQPESPDAEFKSSHRFRRPRSLLEALSRVQQTSHTAR